MMVLDKLQESNPKGFAQVCYEIGEAYLFYYDIGVEKDKYATASTWFQYAQDDYPIAKMYCDISSCMQNISKYSKAGQLAKLNEEYTSLWNQITALDSSAVKDFVTDTEGLDLKLRVWNEIIKMINNNAGQICEVTPKETVINFIDEISANCAKIDNAFLKNSIASLNENITNTKEKINSIKTNAEEAR